MDTEQSPAARGDERAVARRLIANEAIGVDFIRRIADEWNALVERSVEPAPFLRAGWQLDWWEAFGEGRPVIVTVRDGASRLVGAALFAERRERIRGIPTRLLALASNVHSNRADLVADASLAEHVGTALGAWASARRPRWTALVLDSVPGDSPVAIAFRAELERLGHRSVVRMRETPPVIPLAGGYESVLAGLAAKWRSNLRNRERRFAELGPVTHETFRGAGEGLESRLAECFALEARAWKGAAGSAITSSEKTFDFYRAAAGRAGRDGTLALQILRSGSRLAAFQLDLAAFGVEYVLKIGYEPELAALSPGALLLRRTIESACAAGMRAVDLLGDDMPWKRDWTSVTRPHARMIAFGRGPAGRSLAAIEVEARDVVHALRKRFSGAPAEGGKHR